MFWGWNTVAQVMFLQAALVLYYLVWPALSKGLIWLSQKLSKYLPQPEPPEDTARTRTRPYRGNWRDTQYHRAQESDAAQWQEHRQRRAEKAYASGTIKSQHLRLLGLTEPVHLIEIKSAYLSMAKTYHPDRYASNGHNAAERMAAARKMRQVNEAYDWLCANP